MILIFCLLANLIVVLLNKFIMFISHSYFLLLFVCFFAWDLCLSPSLVYEN
nr:MAG TPA: hypothetical protein [Caudoviricetes sp.]